MQRATLEERSAEPPATSNDVAGGGWYGRYVLGVLVLVYVLNFIDRQILSVLAEQIKADLQITDAKLGFLFGAAFATFYAVMGLPLARLADVWNRKRLISIGLSFWSLMTALSGIARGFLPLAVCRFGVGVGEASASPAAYSLLYDYFSPRVRTTVLAIYSGGVFIGQGIGIFLGGMLLHFWLTMYPDSASAPFGLKGWQAAFFIVGLPGLALALWVATLKEPARGALDGLPVPPHPHPFKDAFGLLAAMLPPTSVFLLARRGGAKHTFLNLLAGTVLTALAMKLIRLTGDTEQWIAVAIGAYAVVCWMQTLTLNDKVCAKLVFGSRTLLFTVIGVAATNFMLNSFGYWSIPYYQRHFHLEPRQVGLMIGAGTAAMGLVGVFLGGVLSDRLRLRFASGKLLVVLGSLIGSLAAAALLLGATSMPVAYAGSLLLLLFSSAGLSPAVSTLNDMVLPRMRATSSAFGFMVTYLIAGSLGPYAIGKLSDVLSATAGSPGEGLRQSMLVSLVIPLIGIVFVVLAIRSIGHDEPRVIARARELGESV